MTPPDGATALDRPGDAELADGLARWITARQARPTVGIRSLERPTTGYSSETIFADTTWTDDRGHHLDRLVLRMAPRTAGVLAHYDLQPQWEAQMAAAQVGVPVPDPVLEADPGWIGAPFIVMPRVDGHIVGAIAHLDPWFSGLTSGRRARIHDDLLATLAVVHRADPSSVPAVPRRDYEAELDYWEAYLSWSCHGRPVPALVRALRWCREHRPAHEPAAVLLWGDVRLENMVFDDDGGLRTVLDWDMTSIGAPEHDLAWFTSLAFTQQMLFGTRPDGFPDRTQTVARFEYLSGRPVQDLEWYETLAMIKSTAIMTRISVLRQEAGKSAILPIDDNPIIDLLIGRLS